MGVNKRTCLSAGIAICQMLNANAEVKKRVTKIYPLVSDEAKLPYVFYRRTELETERAKQHRPLTAAYVEVNCCAKSYDESVELAEAVNAALDGKGYRDEEKGVNMRSCYLVNSDETVTADAYVQTLVFQIKM